MKNLISILFLFITFISCAQSSYWNSYNLKEHWENNGADEIEGIYVRNRKSVNCNGFGNCKTDNYISGEDYFVLKYTDGYIMTSFDGKMYGTMKKAYGSNKFFLSLNEKYWYSNIVGNIENKTVNISLSNSDELIMQDFVHRDGNAVLTISDVFSPIYKPEKKQEIVKKQKSSGTGFGISSNGIIVTNYHVIDKAVSIKVRGVNSNFNKIYKARVIVSDKNNDLALIQIDDYNFTTLGTIPYTIKTGLSGVGENIFVMGYPLRATMGDEIKLTNGIVSSKSGFQGDINSYQISAPVQPGNSGGPLFDSQGNLIGIINAKHVGAENASYAIKASYLTNLIDLLPTSPKLQTINSLKIKTLIQQVALVKNFVYIIETE